MLHTSKPIGAATAGKYFTEHYVSPEGAYYTQWNSRAGEWHGKYAAEMGLAGEVGGEAFDRLVNGQNPADGEQWIKHRSTHLTASGKELAHRAAWDMTFNAPKEVSLTALVGGDTRVHEAHKAAVRAALDAGEMYTQAHGREKSTAVTTGKWAVAMFEHDTARPERLDENISNSLLYPAPHVHTHAVLLNMTGADKPRSLETGELFRVQRLMKGVYQSELKHHLRDLGYEVHEGKNGAAEIQGYSKEYLDAESLRSSRIKLRLEDLGLSGRRSEEIIAHQGRNKKLALTPEEVRVLHLARAAEFGDQPKAVVLAARQRAKERRPEHQVSAQDVVTFAKRSITERLAVFDHFDVVSEALKYGRGYVRVQEVEANIAERRVSKDRRAPEFIPVSHGRPNAPGLQYTTRDMVETERDVLARTRAGRNQVQPISRSVSEETIRADFHALNGGRGLNPNQAIAAAGILQSADRITGLQGSAGTGKTSSTLHVVTAYARAAGMQIIGLAPTGRARKELEAAGIPAQTIQRFLVRNQTEPGEKERLFIVDESSLVSTTQYQELLRRLKPGDRVLEVGDIAQHESVEAARIFHEQQLGGMQTHRLTKIVRQQSPALVSVVELLQEGKATAAIRMLGEQGRVSIVEKRKERLDRIATDYAAKPDGTLVISPDNESRHELNQLIRGKLRASGQLGQDMVNARILVARQDLTKEDRKLAGSYEVGMVIRYQSPSKSLGLVAKDYATVLDRHTGQNTVTVQTAAGKNITYDPRQHHGVELFDPQQRAVARGDAITFRSSWKERGITTGDRAIIENIDGRGNAKAVLEDRNRTLQFNLREFQHFDYAYASTSYYSQGATGGRTLVHMETAGKGAKALLTAAMAYVALSRGRHEMRVYTDDQPRLERIFETNEVKKMAMSPQQIGRFVT